MNWFWTAVTATSLFTVYDLLARTVGVKSKNPLAFSMAYNLLASALCLIIFVLSGEKVEQVPLSTMGLTILMTILYAIFERTEYYAHKHVEASVLTIILKLATAITFISSIIFLKERLVWQKVLALALIIGANILISYKNKANLTKTGLIYGVIVALSLGFAWTIDKKASIFYPLSFYAFIGYFVPVIYNLIIFRPKVKAIIREIKLNIWQLPCLAIPVVIGYLLMIKAFSMADASKVILITSSSSIWVLLLGIILLKEKTNIVKKILAGAMVFIGVLILEQL